MLFSLLYMLVPQMHGKFKEGIEMSLERRGKQCCAEAGDCEEESVMDTSKQTRVYIVDIDGTLANLYHRLHFIESNPKRWDDFFDACAGDSPIHDVIDVVRVIGWSGTDLDDPKIIYLTGRPERVRAQTEAWLTQNVLPVGELVMRKDGDHRADTIAKRELMDGIIAKGWRIAGVFEDRPSVCRVWREMGLTVFQMAHNEF